MSWWNAHFAHIVKYIGMSFITWAIAHGFFTGTRQILTALFWVICFVIGTYLEEWNNGDKRMLAYAALLALWIGAVTGWLQHFPDSPERSIWIVPVWFFLSVIFYEKVIGKKISLRYTVIGSLITLIGSIVLYLIVENTSLFGIHTHANIGHSDNNIITSISGETLIEAKEVISPEKEDNHFH